MQFPCRLKIILQKGNNIFNQKVFLIYVPSSFVFEYYFGYQRINKLAATSENRKLQENFDSDIIANAQIVPMHLLKDVCQSQKRKCMTFFFCIARGKSSEPNVAFLHAKIIVPLDECYNCEELSSHLLQCSKCKKAKYCNSDCQTKHWSKHKNDC